ncbi:MAG: glycosyltransferase family 2 protein [Lachnospiraceae bacterium]
MADISVIVPVYNMEKYLEKCLDSLVKQTLDSIEIVCIDDGSTDSSPDILKKYESKYPQKVRVLHKENGGQAIARNLGIQQSTGRYIGFVDSDDYVHADMFAVLFETIERTQCDLVECDYTYIDEADKPLKKYGHVRKYSDKKDMFHNPLVSPWNKLFRREVLIDHQITFPEGVIYEDTAFFLKVIPYINSWEFVDRVFVYHYYHETSTMNANKSLRVSNIFPVLEDAILFYRERNIAGYEKELEYFCARILICSSLKRVAEIPDKKIRKETLQKTFAFIRQYIPEYRKNPYVSGKVGLYMKGFRKGTAWIYVTLLRR